MHTSVCRVLITFFFLVLMSRSFGASVPQQLPLSTTLSLRNATVSNADAITDIIIAAFHDSRHWKYAYQFMDRYPKEHHDCLYEAARDALGTRGVLAQVALLPNLTEPHRQTPIAAALWVLPDYFRSKLGDTPGFSFGTLMRAKCEHRDMNLTRTEDFQHQLNVAQKKYLDRVYSKRDQLYLNTLATHPDYQRRGAGGALVRSGLRIGKDMYRGENVTATLIATEAGEPLYSHLGWESLRNFTIHSLDVVDGDRERWNFDVMKYEL